MEWRVSGADTDTRVGTYQSVKGTRLANFRAMLGTFDGLAEGCATGG